MPSRRLSRNPSLDWLFVEGGSRKPGALPFERVCAVNLKKRQPELEAGRSPYQAAAPSQPAGIKHEGSPDDANAEEGERDDGPPSTVFSSELPPGAFKPGDLFEEE